MEPQKPQSSNEVYELAVKPDELVVAKKKSKPRQASITLPGSTSALSEPRQTNTLQNILFFVLLLLICVPVLLLNLGQPDVMDSAEANSLLRSSETWKRYEALKHQRGFSLECLIPYQNAEMAISDPPGMTWTHMFWFASMDPQVVTPSQLVLRARLCSTFFALMCIICVYWAGYSLGRHRTAMFSMLIFAANPVFIYYARTATPAILHAGWGMLAIAASLWAIRPLRPLPSTERQFTGWIICGLAFGAATLIAGPITLATIAGPVFLLILFCPDRVSHLIGLLASMLIGLLIVAPWLMYAHEHEVQVAEHWLSSIVSVKQLQWDFLLGQFVIRGKWLLLAMLPWLLWILSVMAQPLSRSSKGLRRMSLWLVTAWAMGLSLLLLPMPTPTRIYELLPLTAPICLAVGQLFNHLSDLCKSEHLPRTWRWLRWPQSCIFFALSFLIPWGLANQQTLIDNDYYPMSLAMEIPSHITFCLLLALLGIWVLSLSGVINHRPSRAVICWSLWCLVLATIIITPLSHSTGAVYPGRNETLELAKQIRGDSLIWVHRDIAPDPIDPRILFYLGRPVPSIKHSQIQTALTTLQSKSPVPNILLVTPMDMQINLPGIRPKGLLRYSGLRLWQFEIPDTTSP